jgi:osmotically-inducible protein OsmY
MRTDPTQRSTFKQTFYVVLALTLITALAVVILGLTQQATGQTLTNPAPLKPVQVPTSPATSPTLGQQFDNAVDNLKQGANEASQAIQSEYQKARDAIQSMGIEARVYSRLHWDKDLANASLNVNSPSPGVIAVSGTLPNAAAQTKAIRLAEDTVGVHKVLDQTSLTGSTAAAPPTP